MPSEPSAFSTTLWIAAAILAALMVRGAWRGYRRGPLRQLAGPAALTIGQLGGWLFGGIGAALSKAAWMVIIGLAIYLVGGWSALASFVKSGAAQ